MAKNKNKPAPVEETVGGAAAAETTTPPADETSQPPPEAPPEESVAPPLPPETKPDAVPSFADYKPVDGKSGTVFDEVVHNMRIVRPRGLPYQLQLRGVRADGSIFCHKFETTKPGAVRVTIETVKGNG